MIKLTLALFVIAFLALLPAHASAQTCSVITGGGTSDTCGSPVDTGWMDATGHTLASASYVPAAGSLHAFSFTGWNCSGGFIRYYALSNINYSNIIVQWWSGDPNEEGFVISQAEVFNLGPGMIIKNVDGDSFYACTMDYNYTLP